MYVKRRESILYTRSKIDPSYVRNHPLSNRDFRCILYTSVYVYTLGRRLSATAGLSFCPRSSVNTMINMRHLAFHQTNVSPSFKTSFLSGLVARAHRDIRPTGIHTPLAINSISCLLNVQHAAHAVPNFY